MPNIATEFKLWEKSPDPGAWLLYGARYSAEQLTLKQQQIIDILESRVLFQDDEASIVIQTLDKSELDQSTLALIEELSCINEAIDLHANQADMAGK
jgi:hypothetical protein